MRKVIIIILLGIFVLSGCNENRANKNTSSSIHAYAGIVFEKVWLWGAAEGEYSKALKLNPKNAMAHRGMAMVYFEKQKYDSAIRHARRALKLDRSWVKGYRFLGEAYEVKKNKRMAIDYYRKYLDKEKNLSRAGRKLIEDKIRMLSLD
ncbi:MAG: tetratricopeptide repeat protein [Candidatus Eremiobacteraeota bacterium]|nr:tetratricopeptide repeat protein [Candidatus Eremiobacteraeota bacterium]